MTVASLLVQWNKEIIIVISVYFNARKEICLYLTCVWMVLLEYGLIFLDLEESCIVVLMSLGGAVVSESSNDEKVSLWLLDTIFILTFICLVLLCITLLIFYLLALRRSCEEFDEGRVYWESIGSS